MKRKRSRLRQPRLHSRKRPQGHRTAHRRQLAAPEQLEARLLLTGGLPAPELAGMELADPATDLAVEQIVYLDFDGARDVTYDGPVTLHGIDVPPFRVPEPLVNSGEEIITATVQRLGEIFTGTGVTFQTVQPSEQTVYSSVFIGGDGSGFARFGSFLGLAEQVDAGNWDHGDNALVFSRNVFSGNSPCDYARNLADTIAHEVGHLLGYRHDGSSSLYAADLGTMGPEDSLLDVAATDSITKSNTSHYAYDGVGLDKRAATGIYIGNAPDNAVVTSITVNWNVDSNKTQDVVWFVNKGGWTSSYYYDMSRTGNDLDWGAYDETSQQSKDVNLYGTGITPNGWWWFNIYDAVSDSRSDWNKGRIDWWQITIKYSYAPPQPDLVVSSVDGVASAYIAGQKINATTTVKNSGQATAGSSYVHYYLGKADGSDSTYRTIEEGWIQSLNTDESANDIINGDGWTVPADVPAGRYRIWVKADSRGGVGESDESNNWGSSAAFTITSPDDAGDRPDHTALPLSLGTWPNSASISRSQSVGRNDTNDYYQVAVAGGKPLTIRLTGLSGDADLQLVGDLNNDGHFQGDEVLRSSARGGTADDTITYTPQLDSLYYIRVVPYSNSTIAYTLIVTGVNARPPQPVITSVAGIPSTIAVGQPFTVTVTAGNNGGLGGPDSAINASVQYADDSDNLSITGPISHDKVDSPNTTSVPWADYTRNFAPGEQIWHQGPTPTTSQDHLIEAGDKNWQPGEQHTFTFTVTPQQKGTLQILLRTTLRSGLTFGSDDSAFVNCIPPDSQSVLDQQGWEAGRFEVTVLPDDDPYEENNSLNSAYDLSGYAGVWLADIQGRGRLHDDDWYRIEVPADQRRVIVNCHFEHREGDIDLELYDSAGRRLAASSSSTSNERIDAIVPAAGTYFVLARHDAGGNRYDLRWEHVSHEPNPNSLITLLGDLAPEMDSSYPRAYADVNGTVFFTANQTELWRTDGTVAGTIRVADTGPATDDTSVEYLYEHSGTAVFLRHDEVWDPDTWEYDESIQLWKSDGTENGTRLIKSFGSGSRYAMSAGAHFTSLGDSLLMSIDGGDGSGFELWKSDLTNTGTVLVKDINPGPDGSYPTSGGFLRPSFVKKDNFIYFAADDGEHGYELWKSDGTTEGTQLVTDINAGPASSVSMLRANVDGVLYFAAYDDEHGMEPWATDGTAGGTRLVKDITPGPDGTGLSGTLQSLNGVIFFTARNSLWKSDGTAVGTELVSTFEPDTWINELAAVNGVLYFAAVNELTGAELYRSDGTPSGTYMVKDINPGNASSSPEAFSAVGGKLLFSADDGVHGRELWESDGSSAGTKLTTDLNPGLSEWWLWEFTESNNRLFFTADDGQHGYEPFVWKGSDTLTDAGDTLDQAVDLGMLAAGAFTTLPGYVGDGPHGKQDVDLFQIFVAEPMLVSLDVVTHDGPAPIPGSSPQVHLRLLDSQGANAAPPGSRYQDPGTGGQVVAGTRLNQFLSRGTYYVGVSGEPNRRYDPHRAPSGTPSQTTGDYTLHVSTTSSTPPAGDCIPVGDLLLCGDFHLGDDGLMQSLGDVDLNGILSLRNGWVKYDTHTQDVTAEAEVYFGDLKIYQGNLSFPAGQLVSDALSAARSELHDLGLDVYVEQITLLADGIRIQGELGLPNAMGGARIDFAGDHYIEITDSHVNYNIHAEVGSIQLNLESLNLSATGLQLDVINENDILLARLSGTMDAEILDEQIHVDLDGQNGNYIQFWHDGDGPHFTLIGQIEAHDAKVPIKGYDDVCSITYLKVFVNTIDNTYQFDADVQLTIGAQNIGLSGHIGWLNGHFDNIGLTADGFELLVWDKPPIYLDKAGGDLRHLSPEDGIPTVIHAEVGLQLGPDLGENRNLLYLDLGATVDTAGTYAGSAGLYVGDRADPMATGNVEVVWSPAHDELRLDGRVLVGDALDPFIDIVGRARASDDMVWGGFRGQFSTESLPPGLAEVAKFLYGFPDNFNVDGYMQICDDVSASSRCHVPGSPSNFIIVGAPNIGAVRVALVENFNFLQHFRFVDYADLEPYLGGQGGGDGESAPHTFQLDADRKSAIFRLDWEAGDPDLHLLGPDGTLYTPENSGDPDALQFENVRYIKSGEDHVAAFAVKDPAGGLWQVQVINDDGLVGSALEVRQSIQAPEIQVLAPAIDQQDAEVAITWTASSPHSESYVSLYYDDDRFGTDGVLIAADIPADTPAGSYQWNTAGVPTGDYYVYAMINDGLSLPDVSYSLGQVRVIDPEAPPQVMGAAAVSGLSGSVQLRWDPVAAPDLDHYLVHLTEDGAGAGYSSTIATQDPAVVLDHLAAGSTYRIAVSAVDTDGHQSQLSEPVLAVLDGVTADTSGSTPQWPVFATPGQFYKALVPGDPDDTFTARSLPAGADLGESGVFSWDVPADASGWHTVIVDITAADGTERVERFLLWCDQDAPQMQELPTAEADAHSIRLTLPDAHDVAGVPRYQLERDGILVANWQAWPTFTDSDLAPNTPYTYRGRAVDASVIERMTAWTDELVVWTLPALPGYPVLENVTSHGASLIAIATDENPVGTEYALYNQTTGVYVAADGTPAEIATWQTRDHWLNTPLTGLQPDTVYEFTLRARNGAGQETPAGPVTEIRTLREIVPPFVEWIRFSDQRIATRFSEPVVFAPGDLVITDSDDVPVDLSAMEITYLATTHTLDALLGNTLTPGTYHLRLSGSSIQDLAANLLDGNADGTPGDDLVYAFEITAAAPVLDLDADDSGGSPGPDFAVTFIEDLGPVTLVDADVTLADSDSPVLTMLTATLVDRPDGLFESLAANTTGTGISAQYEGGSLVLSGTDSVANYLQVLRSLQYDNLSQAPSEAERTIEISATDGMNSSNIAVARVTVTGVNDAPTAADGSYWVQEDQSRTVEAPGLLTLVTDPESDPLCVQLAAEPQHGTVEIHGDGSFTYTPHVHFNREDSFQFVAHDGTTAGDPATVTILIETAYPWHNGAEPANVNADHALTSLDALLVINAMQFRGVGALPPDRDRPLASPFLDVNRDGRVTPIDALLVINRLTATLKNGGGEGETPATSTGFTPLASACQPLPPGALPGWAPAAEPSPPVDSTALAPVLPLASPPASDIEGPAPDVDPDIWSTVVRERKSHRLERLLDDLADDLTPFWRDPDGP